MVHSIRISDVRRYAALIVVCALAACSGKDQYSPYGGTEDPTQIKIGKPYQVKGETYVPRYESDYAEEGMASWYGPKFHGRMTASGERYDQHEMTAAHRTLPMPSIAKVTRLDTGRAVRVRINDRGPFSHRRIIDLSKAAAEELDMIRDGTARVRVEYLSAETEDYIASMGLQKPEGWGGSPRTFAAAPSGDITSSDLDTPAPAPKPLLYADAGVTPMSELAPQAAPPPVMQVSLRTDAFTPQSGRFRIQAGSFGNPQNAQRVAGDLSALGAANVRPVQAGGQQYYRVSLGPLQQYAEAQRLLEQVRSMGYRDARIMVDDS